jgi:hypothetical protein
MGFTEGLCVESPRLGAAGSSVPRRGNPTVAVGENPRERAQYPPKGPWRGPLAHARELHVFGRPLQGRKSMIAVVSRSTGLHPWLFLVRPAGAQNCHVPAQPETYFVVVAPLNSGVDCVTGSQD